MIETFERIMARLVGPMTGGAGLALGDPEPRLADRDPLTALDVAFLVALCGPGHPLHRRASAVLDQPRDGPEREVAAFLRHALVLVRDEIRDRAAADLVVAARLTETERRLSVPGLDPGETAEASWGLFFPEGVGIVGHEAARETELRARRRIRVEEPDPAPIVDAARELLFTSNVLLTIPSSSRSIASLPYPAGVLHGLMAASAEPQRQWFDHPVQVGVEPEANEIVRGLRGLDEALAFEDGRRQAGSPVGRVPCVLSVTVTHDGLRQVARHYVEAELERAGGLRHLAVHVVTEADTRRLVDEVLAPCVGSNAALGLLRRVVGVDGAYGRHYSFLKAIAAFWQVGVDPQIKGTFKIDLDQVFPQAELVAETGRSALEHLSNPSWGTSGEDATGRPVELGLLAGAPVNEGDIGRGLFTPDVPYPAAPPVGDELVFFSRLPQALSTAAEMLVREGTEHDAGGTFVHERVHVTGGTTGALVDALRRHRPFTPTFIGRAEDQAYLLSALGRPGPRLAYLHAAGLVMRHDKEAFAGEAIAAARVDKEIGDHVRILDFSAYAGVVAEDSIPAGSGVAELKELLDPFTGCFVSRLPVTVTALRFALRLARLCEAGDERTARAFATAGAARIGEALDRTLDRPRLREAVRAERAGWNVFYDALDALEDGIRRGDPDALARQRRGREIMAACRVGPDPAS